MTAPAPSGGPSTLRVGGLALLGVGAVAGIIGLATLATGGAGGGHLGRDLVARLAEVRLDHPRVVAHGLR